MKEDDGPEVVSEKLSRADYRKMSRSAAVHAIGVFWRRTGLKQHQVANMYSIKQGHFRNWASPKGHGGPILKQHYRLLIAMFYPQYEDVAQEIFKDGVARCITDFRKKHLRISKAVFAKQYGLDDHTIGRWERSGNSFSPSLSVHFALVKQILRFAVERYERRIAREVRAKKKQSSMKETSPA